ncbi:MAG: hypothetical protein K6348_04125, partial [Deferribacterales bacterium]
MMYERLIEINKNYVRRTFTKEEIDKLYGLDFKQLVDYIGKNYIIWEQEFKIGFEYEREPNYLFFK